MDAVISYHAVERWCGFLLTSYKSVLERHPLWGETTGLLDHVLKREAGEVVTHVVTHLGPYAQKHTLAFVVAGPVAVGFAEVARHNWTVDGSHNFGQRDRGSVAGEDVAAAHPSLRANEPHALEAQENLLEVGLRETSALGEVTNGNREVEVVAKRQAQ